MADRQTDQYEETRRRLGIPNLLDSSLYQPGDPLLVRHVRRLDRALKRNPYIVGTAKKTLPILKKAKSAQRKLSRGTSTKSSGYKPRPIEGQIFLPRPAERPDVSIVIPVFNHISDTMNCLRSLAGHESVFSFEVIVVDNASSDATEKELVKVKNLVYIRNKENLGFVGGCNTGADAAKGQAIVFLNNDTDVLPGWLDYLITDLEESDTGLVGSKLIYPDGSLQEAGGIIFNDATGTNYGKHQAADYYTFNYRREVDYCSGASIAIRTPNGFGLTRPVQ